MILVLVDIHTHNRNSEGISIVNYHENYNSISENEFCSAGIHPKFLTSENADELFSSLKINATKKSVVAIGECGIDLLINNACELQKKYFRQQLTLAQDLSKPLILHCVRAHEMILQIIRKMKITVPVVFHGFNKKWELAENVIKRNHYLSFGTALINNPSAALSFQKSPLHRIFLETDDSGVDIYTIYEVASKLKSLKIGILANQIHENAALVFGERIFAK